FAHMIETFYGLARLGHTDTEGMPHLLQLATGRTRVQRRDRFSFAATGSAARAFWCAHSDCALARLSSDIPSALPDGAGAANINIGVGEMRCPLYPQKRTRLRFDSQ